MCSTESTDKINLTREHGMKVGRASRENHTMGKNLLVGDDEDDVAEFAMLPQNIDRLTPGEKKQRNR